MLRYIQLDPNGVCNSRCWFCPVAYTSNQKHKPGAMTILDLHRVLDQISKYRSVLFVETAFLPVFTAHYNEIFLYKHFGEMLDLLTQHFMKAVLFSNGTTLNPEIIKLLKTKPHAYSTLTLNIPAYEKEKWMKATALSSSKYDDLIENIKHLCSELPFLTKQGRLTIQINGTSLDKTETEQQARLMGEVFPEIPVKTIGSLVDRAGYLEERGILSNRNQIDANKGDMKVVTSCNYQGGAGGRLESWIHINKNSDIFLCCNDFEMDYVFGNLREQELIEIWQSSKRKLVIEKAKREICNKCVHAQWGYI